MKRFLQVRLKWVTCFAESDLVTDFATNKHTHTHTYTYTHTQWQLRSRGHESQLWPGYTSAYSHGWLWLVLPLAIFWTCNLCIPWIHKVYCCLCVPNELLPLDSHHWNDTKRQSWKPLMHWPKPKLVYESLVVYETLKMLLGCFGQCFFFLFYFMLPWVSGCPAWLTDCPSVLWVNCVIRDAGVYFTLKHLKVTTYLSFFLSLFLSLPHSVYGSEWEYLVVQIRLETMKVTNDDGSPWERKSEKVAQGVCKQASEGEREREKNTCIVKFTFTQVQMWCYFTQLKFTCSFGSEWIKHHSLVNCVTSVTSVCRQLKELQ